MLAAPAGAADVSTPANGAWKAGHHEHSSVHRTRSTSDAAAVGTVTERGRRSRSRSRRGQPGGCVVIRLVPARPTRRPCGSCPGPDRPDPGKDQGSDELRASRRRGRLRRPRAGPRHRALRAGRDARGAEHERLHQFRPVHRPGRRSERGLYVHRAPLQRHSPIAGPLTPGSAWQWISGGPSGTRRDPDLRLNARMDVLPVVCKQGVRGSSPLSSTSRFRYLAWCRTGLTY